MKKLLTLLTLIMLALPSFSVLTPEKQAEAEAHYQKAIYLANGNRYNQEALDEINKAIAIRQDVAYNLAKGTILRQLGSYEEALKYYDLVLKEKPDFGFGYAMKATTYFYMQDYKKSLENSDLAIKYTKEPRAETYMVQGLSRTMSDDKLGAAESFSEALKLSKTRQEKFANLSSRATAYMEAGQFDKADADIEELKKLNPQAAKALTLTRYFLSGNFKDALKIAQEMNKQNKSSISMMLLAALYDLNGKTKNAGKTYNELVKDYPNSSISYFFRGSFYLGEDKYKEAAEDFKMVKDNAPLVEINRAAADYFLGKKEESVEKLTTLEKATAAAKTKGALKTVYLTFTEIYIKDKKFADALSYLNKYIEIERRPAIDKKSLKQLNKILDKNKKDPAAVEVKQKLSKFSDYIFTVDPDITALMMRWAQQDLAK